MESPRPYLDYTFTGVTSFVETLSQTPVSYKILSENIPELFAHEKGILTAERDTAVMGECSNSGITRFFLDIGLMISPNIRSHIVFVYDHRPDLPEMQSALEEMERLTVEKLKTSHGDEIKDLDRLDEIS